MYVVRIPITQFSDLLYHLIRKSDSEYVCTFTDNFGDIAFGHRPQ